MRAAGKWRWLIVAALIGGTVGGCRGADGAVANALINTGLAMGSAAVERAGGGCYSACPTGTTCDAATGYCLPLPCRGQCRSDERCVESGVSERCEALALPEGGLDVRPVASTSDAPRKAPEPSL